MKLTKQMLHEMIEEELLEAFLQELDDEEDLLKKWANNPEPMDVPGTTRQSPEMPFQDRDQYEANPNNPSDPLKRSGYADGKKKAEEKLIAFQAGEITEPTKEDLLALITTATEGKDANYAQMYKFAFQVVWSATLTPPVPKHQLPHSAQRKVSKSGPAWGLPPDPDLEP